jgi:tetratricopeptide (TPR) repeat protein
LLWQLEEPRWATMPGLPKLREELSRSALLFLQEQFVRDDAVDPAVLFESGRVYLQLANIHCGQQEGPEGLDMLNKALEQFGRLVAEYPDEPRYRQMLAEAFCFRGTLHNSLKHPLRAESDYREAISQYRRLMQTDGSGDMCNRVAWLLAECPLPSVRRPAEAVALAKEAVARESAAKYWNTLGVAYYRNRSFKEARTALDEAMRRNEGGEPTDWFFQAMTCERLGDRPQALRWFKKGADWVSSHPPLSGEWFRAGAEAAAMLGQKPPSLPGAKETASK